MATDYDCWKELDEPVSVQAVIASLNANAQNAEKLLLKVLPALQTALENGSLKAVEEIQGSNKFAIITAPSKRNAETVKKLEFLLPGYY